MYWELALSPMDIDGERNSTRFTTKKVKVPAVAL